MKTITLRAIATFWAVLTLSVFMVPVLAAQASTPIKYDKAANATLNGGQSVNYTFSGKTGDKLTIAMNAIGGDIDPFLDVYDPQNHLIGEDDNGGGKDNALLSGLVLASDGTYKIVASNHRNTGKYSLIVTNSPIQGMAMINFEGPQIKQNYQLSAPWDHKNVTYRIENSLPQFNAQDVNNVLAQAFQSWANVTLLTFQQVSSGKTDLDIKFAPIDGPLNILGETCPPSSPCSGQIQFDSEEPWTLGQPNGYRDISLLGVASHEFGHAIGLLHSSDGNALMYPSYNPNNLQPGADDIRGAQALYGAGSGRVTSQPAPAGSNNPPASANQMQVNGTLTDKQFTNFWDFDVQQGDTVTITMKGTGGGLDSFLIVLDANNHIIAYDDDNGGGRDAQLRNIHFPQVGTYTVAATRYQQAQGYTNGNYTLTIQYGVVAANAPVANAPAPTSVPVNPVNNGSNGGTGSVHVSAGQNVSQNTSLDTTVAFPFDDSLVAQAQTRDANVQRNQAYTWARTWCAANSSALDKSLANVAVSFAINGSAVNNNMVTRSQPHSGTNGASCVDYFVVLSNWSAGQLTLKRTLTLRSATYNGTNIYGAGDYVDQYNVRVQ